GAASACWRPGAPGRRRTMLRDWDLRGADLPPKTICLTYDDGPGPSTRELGEFLHAEGVPAAFFVIGSVAERQTGLLAELAGWGHAVGNHTWSHPGLVDLAHSGGDVVEEGARADAAARAPAGACAPARGPGPRAPPGGRGGGGPPPGGPEAPPTPIVAGGLRHGGRFDDYGGRVGGDVGAEEGGCGGRGARVEGPPRR